MQSESYFKSQRSFGFAIRKWFLSGFQILIVRFRGCKPLRTKQTLKDGRRIDTKGEKKKERKQQKIYNEHNNRI
nr:MAG TPA: hypothetical protein [Caudoviricetes sp.]